MSLGSGIPNLGEAYADLRNPKQFSARWWSWFKSLTTGFQMGLFVGNVRESFNGAVKATGSFKYVVSDNILILSANNATVTFNPSTTSDLYLDGLPNAAQPSTQFSSGGIGPSALCAGLFDNLSDPFGCVGIAQAQPVSAGGGMGFRFSLAVVATGVLLTKNSTASNFSASGTKGFYKTFSLVYPMH